MTKKNLFIVLGMHRSGTSLITMGLKTLGINLGHELLGGDDSNVHGHFEDIPTLFLNEQLMSELGGHWTSLIDFNKKYLQQKENYAALVEKAQLRINQTLNQNVNFGFKDPRTVRLFSFWEDVLLPLPLQSHIVAVLRNPKSVAQSLENRDGFEHQFSLYLWGVHTIETLCVALSHSFVIVDYDDFMDSPAKELKRIANTFHLQWDPDVEKNVKELATTKISKKFQHSHFHPKDIDSDASIPLLIKKIYTWGRSLVVELKKDEQKIHFLNESLQLRDQIYQEMEKNVNWIPTLTSLNKSFYNAKQDAVKEKEESQRLTLENADIREHLQKGQSQIEALKTECQKTYLLFEAAVIESKKNHELFEKANQENHQLHEKLAVYHDQLTRLMNKVAVEALVAKQHCQTLQLSFLKRWIRKTKYPIMVFYRVFRRSS